MSHRKWKETKQQPGTAGPDNIPGWCIVYLRSLSDIHSVVVVKMWFYAIYTEISDISKVY